MEDSQGRKEVWEAPSLPWHGPSQIPRINSALLQKEAGMSSPGGWLSLGNRCWNSARPTLAPKEAYGATEASGWQKLSVLGGSGRHPPPAWSNSPLGKGHGRTSREPRHSPA